MRDFARDSQISEKRPKADGFAPDTAKALSGKRFELHETKPTACRC